MKSVKRALFELHQACLNYLTTHPIDNLDEHESIIEAILKSEEEMREQEMFINSELVKFVAMLCEGGNVLKSNNDSYSYYNLHLEFLIERILKERAIQGISSIFTQIIIKRYLPLIKSNGQDLNVVKRIIHEYTEEWRVICMMYPE